MLLFVIFFSNFCRSNVSFAILETSIYKLLYFIFPLSICLRVGCPCRINQTMNFIQLHKEMFPLFDCIFMMYTCCFLHTTLGSYETFISMLISFKIHTEYTRNKNSDKFPINYQRQQNDKPRNQQANKQIGL